MIGKIDLRYWAYKRKLESLGFLPSLLFVAQKFRSQVTTLDKPFLLRSRYAQVPLKCRPNTSDIDVFRQIFIKREYQCLDDVRDVGLVIDCGANVGYSSAYMLSRFPNSYVIAIEPDEQNYIILKSNLAPFKNRYHALQTAVWSHSAGVVLSEIPFRDGREWARTVREVREGEIPTMSAVDIGSLLETSGYERISILKIDIEGAESIVFSSNYDSWIGKVDNLVIELHGNECRAIFSKAISTNRFALSECGELTVCKRLTN